MKGEELGGRMAEDAEGILQEDKCDKIEQSLEKWLKCPLVWYCSYIRISHTQNIPPIPWEEIGLRNGNHLAFVQHSIVFRLNY